MKVALVVEAVIILMLWAQFARMRRTRSRLANQLLKIVYETSGRKGVVSHLTMMQSVEVMKKTGCLREQASKA